MTPEELKVIEERYNYLVNNEKVKDNFLREMCRAIVDTGKLLAYLKELESQTPRWIPVEERLPEETVVVIVCSKNLGVIPGAFHKDGRWYWDLGIMKDVTHWQPFPKGPEE